MLGIKLQVARVGKLRSSGKASAVMNTLCTLIIVAIPLGGCGQSATPVPPPIAAKADVIVTLDGKQHACVVSLYSEAQGSIVPCDDIVPFLRDELRVPSGAIYDIRTIAHVDDAEMAKIGTNLKGAGYRFIGGHKDR
jgi:hypothetical protein